MAPAISGWSKLAKLFWVSLAVWERVSQSVVLGQIAAGNTASVAVLFQWCAIEVGAAASAGDGSGGGTAV